MHYETAALAAAHFYATLVSMLGILTALALLQAVDASTAETDPAETRRDATTAGLEASAASPCRALADGWVGVMAQRSDHLLMEPLLRLYGLALDEDAERLGLAPQDRVRITAQGLSLRADNIGRQALDLASSEAEIAYAFAALCPGYIDEP